MSRYERRIYFEWLVEKRAAYAALGDEDRTPIITISDVIAWAEHELARTSVDRTPDPQHPDSPAGSHPSRRRPD